MVIPPPYTVTSEMIEIITQIESLFHFFSAYEIPLQTQEKIQRVSLLKSSLYSARIEGNPLTLENFQNTSNKIKQKEVENIILALKSIKNNMSNKIKFSNELLLELHKIVMKDLSQDAGYFRTEMNAIFNQFGVAVYIPPPPTKVRTLINELAMYIEDDNEKFPLVKAFIAHIVFEKIHPFLDGNGRVGRLLITTILQSKWKKASHLIPYEEYLDQNKDQYYYHLDKGLAKADDYLLFMLNGFLVQSEKTKEQMVIEMTKKDEILLPPRQEEIFNILKDHPMVTFDFIKRRFLKVPPRTLSYDLKRLIDLNLVVKIGKTRGSFYKAK